MKTSFKDPDASPDGLIPNSVQAALPGARNNRLFPVIYAGGMLAAGLALLIAKPGIGRVPEARQAKDAPGDQRVRRAAQAGRDAAHHFAPTNVTDSIGRSLVIGGAALLLTRLLDEASGRNDR